MAAVGEVLFTQRHQFHYFPNTGVYRDCDENRWLWSTDGGFTWVTAEQLPGSIVLGNEIPFAVSFDTNDPTAEHHAIVAAYPPDTSLKPGTVTVQGSSDFDYSAGD